MAERKGFALACGLGQGRLRPATGRSFTTDPFESRHRKSGTDALSASVLFGGEEGIRTHGTVMYN